MNVISRIFKTEPTLKLKMAEQFVQEKISSKKVVVFSKTYCPYCVLAKDVIKKYIGNVVPEDQYEIIELENNPNCDKIQDYLLTLTGARTVPRVFINKVCVGGGTDVEKLDKSNKLLSLFG